MHYAAQSGSNRNSAIGSHRKEARKVAAQLLALLKMFWMSFDRPDRQIRRLHEPQILSAVARMTALHDEQAEWAVVAVSSVLQAAFGSSDGTTGTAGHVMSQLPVDLKLLRVAASEQSRPLDDRA